MMKKPKQSRNNKTIRLTAEILERLRSEPVLDWGPVNRRVAAGGPLFLDETTDQSQLWNELL